MNENHISININTDNLNLSSDEVCTLFIEVENNLNTRVDNILLRNFINGDLLTIEPNEFNITNNNFINLGSLDSNEKRILKFNLKPNIDYKRICQVFSKINYSVFENERLVSKNIKSNELEFTLNPNAKSIDKPMYDIFRGKNGLNRGSEMLIDEDYFNENFNSSNNVEPKLIGFGNFSEITKSVDNENPQIGDVITFNCYVKNIGFTNCKKIQYEDELNSCLEFVEGSLYINNQPYNGNICYGIKINNFKVNDEINICYQARVVDLSNGNIFNNSSKLMYSYISNQNINHKTITINFPNISSIKLPKKSKSNSNNNVVFNINNRENILRNRDLFRNELSIATYSLSIFDGSNLSSVIADNKYTYSFRIENDGNMKCEQVKIKIDLPDVFKFIEHSLCLNSNPTDISTLKNYIVLSNIEPGESINIDFEFIPDFSSDINDVSIGIKAYSEFRNYSNEKIEKSLRVNSNPINVENKVLKDFSVEADFHIKNPNPSVEEVVDVECDAFILSCSEIKSAKSKIYRDDNKRFAVKGYVLNKVQYLSPQDKRYSITKKTPFSVVLSIGNDLEFDTSKLKLRCNDVSFKYINKRLINVFNLLSIY